MANFCGALPPALIWQKPSKTAIKPLKYFFDEDIDQNDRIDNLSFITTSIVFVLYRFLSR